MELDNIICQLEIGEDSELEFKLADGGFPRSAWETISAFANTDGGYIILGVKEKSGNHIISGVKEPKKILKVFWDAHNNRDNLSMPICAVNDVKLVDYEGKTLIAIHVPRAKRIQRPVYIRGNPATGTYKRNFEGDYHCNALELRQFYRDATDESLDSKILDEFTIDDLDLETILSFRNRFSTRKPDHPFIGLDNRDFLLKLGAMRIDRLTQKEGITLAGLLMFGCERALLEALPHYHVDYQERTSDVREVRWSYRLTIDGTWQPNLFNFYFRVINRLTSDLSIPFELNHESVRTGKTHVHEALREAFVNMLVHADHQSHSPLLVLKEQNSFTFQNPGLLRVPMEQLFRGGLSDSRNQHLQRMFQFLGLGEKAGSGFTYILRVWKEQHWVIPMVTEDFQQCITTIALPMISLIPSDINDELQSIVGDEYSNLKELDRVILVLAHRFESIRHTNITHYSQAHPSDISDRLKYLVDRKWLVRHGHGRGTFYCLTPSEHVFVNRGEQNESNFAQNNLNFEHYNQSSEHYDPNRSEHYELSFEHYGVGLEVYRHLLEIAGSVRERGRVDKMLVRSTILALCSEDYLSLKLLSHLLNRGVDSLRNHYLTPMLAEELIELKFPTNSNHPQQAYRSKQCRDNGAGS